MINVTARLRDSTFLRHNAIFFAGSVAVGVLNYLYYPVMGRLLEPSTFGEVQTLISLFLQITIFLMVLGLITINIVANYQDKQQRNTVVLEFEKLALLVSLVFLALTIIFQGHLKEALSFESGWPFVLLMVALVASVPFMFRSAFLRGVQRFAGASLMNLLSAGGKLIFGVLLVAFGFGTAGAIGGLIVAQVVAAGVAAWAAYRLGLQKPHSHRLLRLPSMQVLAPELKYGLVVLVGSLIITLQYSIDIVLVKYFFDPHTAGLYAGVASVARIIFFLTASVALVLMPMVKVNQERAKNRALLKKSLLLVTVLILPPLILFSIAPEWVVSVLMGQKYEAIANLLPRLSLLTAIVSVLNVLVAYYLALRRGAIAFVALVGAVATYATVAVNHSSPEAVINSLLFGSLIMLLALFAWVGSHRIKGGVKE